MLLLIGVCFFELLWCFSDMIIKPRKLSDKKMYDAEVTNGNFNVDTYQSIKKYHFKINSVFKYKISCELLKPANHKKNSSKVKIAVLCHGFGCCRSVSLKYMEIFLNMGFIVLIYDHRNHGASGKAFTSMGYYEKFDLRKIIDWCEDTYGKDCIIITHGESMGAATVLLHSEIDTRIKGVIADCSYSDLTTLIKHQLKQYYHMPRFIIPLVSYLTHLRAGFWYSEVSPINAVSKVSIPILFIHGKRDNFVPPAMSKQMYEIKKDKKAIYLVAEAKHAESYIKNRKKYEEVVKKFIQYVLSQNRNEML